LTLPSPNVEPVPGASAGCQVSGKIVRVIRFQSSLRWIGTTGWMFRMFWVPFNGPKLKLVLFWNGTLIKSATGFCNSLASSVALLPAVSSRCSLSDVAEGVDSDCWAKALVLSVQPTASTTARISL
jgi:hypothetical protein